MLGIFYWLIGGFVWFVLFSCGRCCSWCPHSLIICACLWLCPHCNWICTQLLWAALAIHWEGVTLTGQMIECHKLSEFLVLWMVLVCDLEMEKKKRISIRKTRRDETISSKSQHLQAVLAVWGRSVKKRHQLSSLLHPYAPIACVFF